MPELIYRQSALSVCKEYGWIDDEDFIDGYNTAIKDISEAIKELPTVEAEPVRHGRWISEIVPWTDWKGQKRKRFQPTSCSVCHTPVADATNFCPNCGARMDADHIADVSKKVGGADNGEEKP